MTPFDAAALLAMLTAFYPDVSIATLAQARSDRPSYFAGGALVGAGDRLQLGDGRIFLLIWQGAWAVVGATDDPAAAGVWDANRIAAYFVGQGVVVAPSVVAQWLGYWNLWGWKDPHYFLYRLSHAQELVDAGKATPLPADPGAGGLTLDAGPLTPIDAGVVVIPRAGPVFEPLVSDALGGLDGTDAQLDHVTATVAAIDPSQDAAAIDTTELDDASGAHDAASADAGALSVDQLVSATSGQRDGIDSHRADYNEEPPPDQPVPDPGPRPDPGHGGGDGPPKV